jgi:methyl-accepting chemotaxis protein
MSDTRDAFGPLLEKLQGDMREVRGALDLLARTLPGQIQVMILDLRASLSEQITHRFDQIERRMDQTERSVEERLARIEKEIQDLPLP